MVVKEDGIKAAVGFSENPNSFEAGREAVVSAFKNMGEREGSLILAFCTNKHDHQRIFEGIRSEVGEMPFSSVRSMTGRSI